MIFYGLKTCDTCRKAQKELREAGIEPDVIDVRTDGVSEEKLKQWVAKIKWKDLLNTRSTTWRNLDAGDKDNIDVSKAITLMAKHPTLIKRPIIEKDGCVFVGWKQPVKSIVLANMCQKN
ncbi:MAG: Spx/MgsR family RNA polymerase-binding regulatory protein [Robiginitomaculum sp.]